MSVVAGKSANALSQRWMISSGVDIFCILLTPLLAAPAILFLSSSTVGIEATTISLVVASFFALGHHLPGMMRAYGDRDLFARFRWRFMLAPPLVALAYYPIYNYHFGLYRLIILTWATWHGFMQVYGFVRIYDAKVGSTSRATANWDWLVCLWGFVTPQLLRPESASQLLTQWHAAGGPPISPGIVNGARWGCALITVLVLAGFTINYIIQWRRGPRPNHLKLVMLASGIGTWWFAMCYVEELILGIALFDICHDVQYNAIVWMYNRRLVSSNPQVGGFMRYLFRRGMVLLYLGLITAYGAIGLIPPLVQNGAVSTFFYGVIFTSTILHYYYDGFIWKVREADNQANLGLQSGGNGSGRIALGRYSHAIKWSPAVICLGVLFATDAMDTPLTTADKNTIDRTYARTVMPSPSFPHNERQASWLYSHFAAVQHIATAVPDDRAVQRKAATMLANFGQHDDAITHLERLLEDAPDYRAGHVTLGKIHLYRGDLNSAADCYENALAVSRTAQERSRANLTLGEIAQEAEDYATAEARFAAALHDDPQLAELIESGRNGNSQD